MGQKFFSPLESIWNFTPLGGWLRWIGWAGYWWHRRAPAAALAAVPLAEDRYLVTKGFGSHVLKALGVVLAIMVFHLIVAKLMGS